jgi:hypothetical protein
LLANSDTGGAFNIFEAAEFLDKDFPLYIYGRLYSKKDIIIEIAKIIVDDAIHPIRVLSKT